MISLRKQPLRTHPRSPYAPCSSSTQSAKSAPAGLKHSPMPRHNKPLQAAPDPPPLLLLRRLQQRPLGYCRLDLLPLGHLW